MRHPGSRALLRARVVLPNESRSRSSRDAFSASSDRYAVEVWPVPDPRFEKLAANVQGVNWSEEDMKGCIRPSHSFCRVWKR
jgi:hypothetical protein